MAGALDSVTRPRLDVVDMLSWWFLARVKQLQNECFNGFLLINWAVLSQDEVFRGPYAISYDSFISTEQSNRGCKYVRPVHIGRITEGLHVSWPLGVCVWPTGLMWKWPVKRAKAPLWQWMARAILRFEMTAFEPKDGIVQTSRDRSSSGQ